MENENYEKKPSLLSRLCARFHNSKIFKSILELTLATTIATTMVACDLETLLPNGTGGPGIDSEQTENTNNPTDNTTDNSNNSTTDQTSKPDISEYSEILQYVLTDNYYNGIITNLVKGVSKKTDACLDPHPYAFLDDEGYDINQIRNGNLKCESRAFVKENEPNTLYMYTMVETKAETPYYTEYLLKYNLTDKEMADYNMMHENNYIQAVFMNDAVSEFKTPTILSEAKCTIDAHSKVFLGIKDKAALSNIWNGRTAMTMVIKDFDKDNFVVTAYVFSFGNQHNEHSFAEIELNTLGELYTTSDNAFSGPTSWGNFIFKDSIKSVTPEKIKMYWAKDKSLDSSTVLE